MALVTHLPTESPLRGAACPDEKDKTVASPAIIMMLTPGAKQPQWPLLLIRA